VLVNAVRYGLPAVLVLAGFAVLIFAGDARRFDGFAMLVGSGLSVALINVLFRLGASSDRERDDEERARLLLQARPLAPRDPASAGSRGTATPSPSVSRPQGGEAQDRFRYSSTASTRR
jgi:hypothetical protein